MNDREQLQFIYDRMVRVHNENEGADYMLRFKEIIERTPAIASCEECPAEDPCSGAGNEFQDDNCKEFQEKLSRYIHDNYLKLQQQ